MNATTKSHQNVSYHISQWQFVMLSFSTANHIIFPSAFHPNHFSCESFHFGNRTKFVCSILKSLFFFLEYKKILFMIVSSSAKTHEPKNRNRIFRLAIVGIRPLRIHRNLLFFPVAIVEYTINNTWKILWQWNKQNNSWINLLPSVHKPNWCRPRWGQVSPLQPYFRCTFCKLISSTFAQHIGSTINWTMSINFSITNDHW